MTEIRMTRGDDRTIRVRNIKFSSTDAFVDMTGGKAWLTARRLTPIAADEQALFAKEITEVAGVAGQVVPGTGPDFSDGYLQFHIVPADTADADTRSYRYDVQLKLASGAIYTIASDAFVLDLDVTLDTV